MAENTSVIRVTGGSPLNGTVRIPSAKNSVLPIFAASMLCRTSVCLRAIPHLSDVKCCLSLLRGVGMTPRWQNSDVLVTGTPKNSTLPAQTAAQMRASILFCAPLLARLGRAETVLPGGCRIGARPIDLHLSGLAKMGVRELDAGADKLVLTAPSGLHGAEITLRFPSVGATETILLAAVCARGTTILRGAAREPEIVDLAEFLNQCGGQVKGAGSPIIRIEGKRGLSGCVFSPLPDRIFASTLACAAAAAGGRVELTGCSPSLYAPVLEILGQMGCRVENASEAVQIACFGRLHGVGRVFTGVYPGLATDAAPLLAAAMLCAEGESSIEDIIFERRFGCADGFLRMDGNVKVEGRTLIVRPPAQGRGRLHGARLDAPDLRGGAALVLAALAAQGESEIGQTEYIDRGYADFTEILAGLGARICKETRLKVPHEKKHV